MTARKECESACLGCGGFLPAPFLDLGSTPLANAYLRPERAKVSEENFPLAVAYCTNCHLVQLIDRVLPDRMFSQYLYFSSYSDSFLDHACRMANELIERFGLDEDQPGARDRAATTVICSNTSCAAASRCWGWNRPAISQPKRRARAFRH